MKKLLAILLALYCAPATALAQTAITLPIAANAVADLGNGPVKVRMVAGNASIFTSQGSGIGSTSGSSTALTLTGTPATPPIVGGLISGTGITSGTTVAAYNGTTGITLSAAMIVPASTTVSWGAACPSSVGSAPVIQASPQAGYYIMYTQARVCGVSPGGPVNTLLIEPVYYEQISSAVAGSGAAVLGTSGTWTPILLGSSTAGSPSYNTQVGSYEIYGRQYQARFSIVTTALGSPTGNMQIGGFPFTQANTANDYGDCFVLDMAGVTLDTNYTNLTGFIQPNGTIAPLFENGSGQSGQAVPVSKFSAVTALYGICFGHI